MKKSLLHWCGGAMMLYLVCVFFTQAYASKDEQQETDTESMLNTSNLRP